MAKRRREDYQAPSRRAREKRPTPPRASGGMPQRAFPPGTWKKVLVGGLLGALALSALAWFVLDRQRDERRLATALLAGGACETDRRSDPVDGDGHVTDPVFRVDPPAGGTHTEQVARAGVYAGDAVPEDGPLVHALEHGYVVLWHRPGVPTAELERIAEENDGDVIVAERASLPVPVAATAWERRLLCERPDARALALFVDAHVGDGPEDVPRG